ncbi:MAG: hypothetical protein L0Z49_06050 [Actinobacteria bacterium]|nr:hypothetical protein [Actinomycetota bacterium]MCI0543995.1 hypothetical protein [Actinomycetota bacterium]
MAQPSYPRRLALFATALSLIVAACGGGEPTATTAPEEPTTAPSGGGDAIGTIATDLGTILTGPGGLTLYIFTADIDGESSCYNDCAELWPPIPADTPIGPGLDAAMFGRTTRTDGSEQLTVNGKPVYLYTPDTSPGDVLGQGFAGAWFVVDADGEVVGGPEAAAATSGDEDSDDGYRYDY